MFFVIWFNYILVVVKIKQNYWKINIFYVFIRKSSIGLGNIAKNYRKPIAVSPLHDQDVTSKQTLENQKDVFSELDDNRYVWSEFKDSYQKRLMIYNQQTMVRKEVLLKYGIHVIYIAKNPVTQQFC